MYIIYSIYYEHIYFLRKEILKGRTLEKDPNFKIDNMYSMGLNIWSLVAMFLSLISSILFVMRYTPWTCQYVTEFDL